MLKHINGLDALISSRLGGVATQIQPVPGDVPVLQVVVEGYEALPVYLTSSDTQCLCICYLWTEAEVRPERRSELLEVMLDLNIAVPLSAFGRIGEHYVLFGALARDAGVDEIAKEVVALLDNSADALDALAEYLIQTEGSK